MTTIRQVADEAGVSIGTVSRVLNNKMGVGQETRRHVLDIADQLGYSIPRRPEEEPQSVTHLGLLYNPFHAGLANPFYQDVFLGVEKACRGENISLIFNSLDLPPNEGASLLNSFPPLLKDQNLSGLVLIGGDISENLVSTLSKQFVKPIILVDNNFGNVMWDSVMIDNQQGIRLIVEHLIERGHRHIALMSGPDRPSIVERRQGYETVLQEVGLNSFIAQPDNLGAVGADESVKKILDQAPQTTAIACSNDLQAVTTIRALQRLNYKVPEDISVTGFDDTNMAALASPALTTVHVDRLTLGCLGVENLLARIKMPTKPISKTVMGVHLIKRETVCKPRTHNVI
ncbi:MAG: LacI family DNA-binding transcriptional regulator [Chloroflexota bacterium]